MPQRSQFTEGPLTGAWEWTFTVAALSEPTPLVRVVTFESDGLDTFEYAAGQDFMFAIPVADGTVNRRYTIRRVDRAAKTVDVAFVRHGSGPASEWVERVAVGDTIDAIGPRGKVHLQPEVDWHLFVGDDSAVPATMAMIEAIPAGKEAIAFLFVKNEREVRPVTAAASAAVEWVYTDDKLLDAIRNASLPTGSGHAYVNGELRLVNAVKDALIGRGIGSERISVKNYWRRDKPNAPHGEPARD